MTPLITGKVTGGPETGQRIRTLADAIIAELRQGTYNSALAVKERAQEKVSGPVLKAPSGALKGSINVQQHFEGQSILATVGVNLGSIPYARIHEYGGVIDHPGGTAYFMGKDGVAQFISNAAAAASGKNYARTKPHKITIPERSYLRSSLHELHDDILKELRNGVKRAVAASGLAK